MRCSVWRNPGTQMWHLQRKRTMRLQYGWTRMKTAASSEEQEYWLTMNLLYVSSLGYHLSVLASSEWHGLHLIVVPLKTCQRSIKSIHIEIECNWSAQSQCGQKHLAGDWDFLFIWMCFPGCMKTSIWKLISKLGWQVVYTKKHKNKLSQKLRLV